MPKSTEWSFGERVHRPKSAEIPSPRRALEQRFKIYRTLLRKETACCQALTSVSSFTDSRSGRCHSASSTMRRGPASLVTSRSDGTS